MIDASQRTAAKVAGAAFLISFPFLAYAHFGMRGALMVEGNPAESIRRIASAEDVFRLSVVFDLLYCTGLVVLLSALYVVLRPVNRYLALLAAFWKFVYVIMSVLIALSCLTLVRLATSPEYTKLDAAQLHALFNVNWAAPWDMYYIGLAFWALSSTVLGWLWLKSKYIPAGLASFGIVASAWGVFCAFAYLNDPGFANVVHVDLFDVPLLLFEIALSLWLLVKGLRPAAMLG
jgi:hypothetical protein